MPKGTYKSVMAITGAGLSDIRKAFGRTAADLAKEVLNEKINAMPEDVRRRVIAKPGDAWRTVVRHVYKAVARVMRDKLARKDLSIGPDGKFNITRADIAPLITGLDADLRETLRREYNVTL